MTDDSNQKRKYYQIQDDIPDMKQDEWIAAASILGAIQAYNIPIRNGLNNGPEEGKYQIHVAQYLALHAPKRMLKNVYDLIRDSIELQTLNEIQESRQKSD